MRSATHTSLLIKNANIITMADKGADSLPQEIRGGFIGVRGGIIDFVGAAEPLNTNYDEVFDADGAIITPGFINAHTHIPMTLLRGLADDLPLHDWLFNHIFPREAQLTENDIYAGAKIALSEMLQSGTTCFCDMYFMEDQVLRATLETPMRANLGSGLACLETDIDFSQEKCILDFERLRNTDATSRYKFAISPHAIYTSSLEYLKYCASLGNIYHVHISETQKENKDCIQKYGKTPTQVLKDAGFFQKGKNTNAAHCVWLTDEDIEIFVKNNASITHCPSSNLKLASGIAPIEKYISAGINVALGTDGAASNNSLNMLNEIRLAALIHKGNTLDAMAISAQTALEMATKNGAKALGRDVGAEDLQGLPSSGDLPPLGQIKEGYAADFVFFETKSPNMQPFSADTPATLASAVVYSADRANITHTMIAGEFVVV